MKATNSTVVSITAALLAAFPCFGQAEDSQSLTVKQLYPYLASGVLTHAKVETLPEGLVLKSEGVEIRSSDIEKIISRQSPQLRTDLRKNAFFVLEQEATAKLLKKTAAQQLSDGSETGNAVNDNQLIQAFIEKLTKEVNVTRKDVERFYKENERIFAGAPLESVRKQIKSYVLRDKKQRFVDHYIQTLGQKVEIAVSASWTKEQAVSAKSNPLDKARDAGKPTLAIFSAASCCGPDKMIPVKEALLKEYGSKITIVYIEPRKEPVLAARYGIRSIPSQIIFNSKGQEYFRHSGFLSEEDIIRKFTELGVE